MAAIEGRTKFYHGQTNISAKGLNMLQSGVFSTVCSIEEQVIAQALDTPFYLRQVQAIHGVDPYAHYLEFGAAAGLDPCPGFSTQGYREYFSRQIGIHNPFVFFLSEGRKAGLHFSAHQDWKVASISKYEMDLLSPFFDENFYRAQLNTVDANLDDVLSHYMSVGVHLLLDPSPEFSTAFYLKMHPDVRKQQINPLVHYAESGRLESRVRTLREAVLKGIDDINPATAQIQFDASIIKSEFDQTFYLRQVSNPEDIIDPLIHFIKYGVWRGYDPNPMFSTEFYLDEYRDVRDHNINPFAHFLTSGKKEGRLTKARVRGWDDGIAMLLAADAGLRSELISVFDPQFYASQLATPEYENKSEDLLNHYLSIGSKAGLEPTSYFSTDFYLKHNTVLLNHREKVFEHFISNTAHARRLGYTAAECFDLLRILSELSPPTALNLAVEHFDPDYYLSNSPDLVGADMLPIVHYLRFGWEEFRNPSPFFSTEFYIKANADVRALGYHPFLHYICVGRNEGRRGVFDGRPGESESRWFGFEHLSNEERSKIEEAFDSGYYLLKSPDLEGSGIDLLEHYLQHGWKEFRDPSDSFSTSYYINSYEDIQEADICPLVHYVLHGAGEGRYGLPYARRIAQASFYPLVTAIVPNYNHARFLDERLKSIANQSYQNIEIVVLDDRSSDNSREVIEAFKISCSRECRTIFNDVNSGNVFRQWNRGIAEARGELLWICESDDFCDPEFLQTCVRAFVDRSLMICFGRVLFVSADGEFQEGLDEYRENAESGIWGQAFSRPAAEWFRGTFGICNVIPNVGGCVIRNQPIDPRTWEEVYNYKVVGDWFLYLTLSRGGRIGFEPGAVAYFRQHGKNTSVTSFQRAHYYEEHERISRAIAQVWGTNPIAAARFFSNLYTQYMYAEASHLGQIHRLYSVDRVLGTSRQGRHILVAFLGFHLGGGELFPIHLSNALHAKGFTVSVLVLNSHNENTEIRKLLNPAVPIYEAQLVQEIGIERFIHNAGIDLIHSHYVGLEFFLLKEGSPKLSVPYIVTLHGSYEVTHLPNSLVLSMLKNVCHWTYLSSNNLTHLSEIPLDPNRITFIPNGMPAPLVRTIIDRGSLGIGPKDLVFVIASRAIQGKGWEIAISALGTVLSSVNVSLRLLLIGDGPELGRLQEKYGDLPWLHFLGFQQDVDQFLRISDVLLLPTRFPGESYPLILIQGMQLGLPIVATDVGQIKSMLRTESGYAGQLIENREDDKEFVEATAREIKAILNERLRMEMGQAALERGREFDISSVADRYVEVYERYIDG